MHQTKKVKKCKYCKKTARNNNQKKLKRNNKSKAKIIIGSKMIGGNGPLDISKFFEELGESNKAVLNTLLIQSLESEIDNKGNLNDIIESYKEKANNQLYDFIYTKNDKQQYVLDTLWDHETGKPESITAGKPGVHIYVVKMSDGKFAIIGKFERNIS